jgi:ATP-dependent phosphofructokinase / diphosphate-dependent phosphofructokinase
MNGKKRKKFGILTSGGDCPGLNAAIRGVAKALFEKGGAEIIGISDGFRGLIEGRAKKLNENEVSGILTRGGTILGTSREKPFNASPDESSESEIKKPEKIKKNYHRLGLDGLIILGGNGTHKTSALLSKEGLNVIGLPKTIDNDIPDTDLTFGFNSAVEVATQAIDRLHSTAHSHNRIMVIETMGHKTGWLALYSGVAGGGDIVLIPEIPYCIDTIASHLYKRAQNGKRFSIVVVAEGAIPLLSENEAGNGIGVSNSGFGKGYQSRGVIVTEEIEKKTGMETRLTVLGYLQRGGVPAPTDRILATQFGTAAAELAYKNEFGCLVVLKGNKISSIKFSEMTCNRKTVPLDDHLLKAARFVGTCFGDKCIF